MVFPDHSRPFNNTYRCYSVSMLPGNERQDVEKGGKSKFGHVRLIESDALNNNSMFYSYHATICLGSTNKIECRISNVV